MIDYSRSKDNQFLWLAEASESWTDKVSEYAVFTPYVKVLVAGFDCYYGSFFNLKNYKTGRELINQIINDIKDCLKEQKLYEKVK